MRFVLHLIFVQCVRALVLHSNSGKDEMTKSVAAEGVGMNCFLSYWVPVFQALLTPAVAFLAVVIALFQWRTAHKRVVIDLFDRRMKIYTDCRDVLHRIVASPNATTTENGIEFKRARADAEFLFGDKVVRFLEKVEEAIFDLATSEAELKGTSCRQERKDFVAKSRAALETIRSFYEEEFRSLLRPYMRLTQGLWW
jgi:hypothetical protein